MKKLSLTFALALSASPALHAAPPAPTPVAAPGGELKLSPDNSRIQFVCAHKGAEPNPRTGTFKTFTGTAALDAATKSLKSLSLEIDVNSVSTEFGNLTAHLKSPDFFDTRQHPKARFASKSIAAGAKPGEVTITGDLTLHGVTQEITAPATIAVSGAGTTVVSEFTIDRTKFKMSNATDKIESEVKLTFVIGEKTKALAEAGR